MSFALGGILACTIAGFISLYHEAHEIENKRASVEPDIAGGHAEGENPDPLFLFYIGLVVILLVGSIRLNDKLEPEDIKSKYHK